MNTIAFLAVLGTATARVFDQVPSGHAPHGWSLASPALGSDKVTLKIALKQPHAAALEQTVLAVSTPGNPAYGKHLSREELRALVAPTASATSDVSAWLAEYGIVPAVDNDWMTIATDVATANALLDANFQWYAYAQGGGKKLRTLSYSVPDAVAPHVDLVQPTTRFGGLAAARSTVFDVVDVHVDDLQVAGVRLHEAQVSKVATAAANTSCVQGSVNPACLKAMYKIGYTPSPDGNLVAFASYLEEYARYNDLEAFQREYLPEAVGQNFSVTLINGGANDQESKNDSVEANLDVQYVQAISAPIPILEYSTGGRGPLIPSLDNRWPNSNEPYLEFLTYVVNLTDAELPQTLTTSYGEDEQSVPVEYALKVCNLFMQLGGRGVSILFASGDFGPGASCKSNVDNTTTTFQASFPAGCPYVTSVGGTTGSGPERGAFFSGGGFSDLHAQPAYQADAVGAYLDSINDTYAAFFNRSGRGIPDVAAQGQGFRIKSMNRTASVSGTSASSPVFAGVVALLNAARKAQGMPGLGFLNPFLYNNSAAFTDIVTGASTGCRSAGGGLPVSGASWNCTDGWDPVTGLGTPLFDLLLEAAAPGTKNE